MKALIFENKVVGLVETEHPVSPSLKWVDAPLNCKRGWQLIDEVLTAPPDPPEKTWDQKRREEYPNIGDQLDMQYWDQVNGTTTFQDAIAKVKSDNPKKESEVKKKT